MLKELKNYDVLIVSNDFKKRILKEINLSPELCAIKFFTLSEFIKKITYQYDEKAIFYVMNKYHVKYEVAKVYLENTYAIEQKDYSYQKLNFLKELKQELKEFFSENLVFQDYVKTHSCAVVNYLLEPYEEKILDQFHVQKITLKKAKKEEAIPVYEFTTIEEEVDFVIQEIFQLLEKGVTLEQIKLTNVSQEYYHTLETLFSFFNLPLELPSQEPISGTLMAHFVLEHLSFSKEEMWNQLEKEFDLTKEENHMIALQILNILNCYSWCENLKEVEELIQNDFLNCKKKEKKWEKAITVVDFSNAYFDDSEFVFVLGFNQGILPRLYKDEDFIPDMMKQEVLLFSTLEKNKLEQKMTKEKLESISNVVITYKLKTPFDTYLPSNLLAHLNVEKRDSKVFHRNHYSKLYDQLKLGRFLDDFHKYGVIHPELSSYFFNYPQISYQTYQNQFNGISKNQLFHRINSHLKLSYTALDSYCRCGFRYYVNRILKCDPFEETFSLFIGDLFHDILSKAFQPNFDFEKEWSSYLETKKSGFDAKETFFLSRLKKELQFDINTILLQNKSIGFKNQCYEENIVITKEKEIPVTFHGIIDKLYYQKEEETLCAIVDYKTGTLHTDLNQTIYGINMQLPIYLFLIKRHKLQNVRVVGFYLQKILNNEPTLSSKEPKEEAKRKQLKLVGYSTMNHRNLKNFDPNYEESSLIKGMKVGKNGFYSSAKVLSDEKMELLDNVVERNIDENAQKIIDGEFMINPKVIGFTNVGCENCHYQDLCYFNEKNKVYLKEYKNLEFLEK